MMVKKGAVTFLLGAVKPHHSEIMGFNICVQYNKIFLHWNLRIIITGM